MGVLYAVSAYFAAGLFVAIAFVILGISRVLAEPRPASLGARLLLIPGAAVLWPYILVRWIKGGRSA